MKRPCEHRHSYKGHLTGGLLTGSEVQPMIIMAGSLAASMALEELRIENIVLMASKRRVGFR